MAVDEAILEAVISGESPATLRLYAWEPPCLSLGYAQPSGDVDMASLNARGWHLVRRPTGGRAILHTDELTYAVIGPEDDPRLSGSVLESYQRLSQALLLALLSLGIPAQAESKPPASPAANQAAPVCFEVPSNYEITVQGRKIIGSAQARRKGAVLQHGSFPLQGDLTRITGVLTFADQAERARAAERLTARALTAQEVLAAPLTWDQAASAFCRAFAQALNLELTPTSLSASELERAERLVTEKYANPQWTERV